MLLAPSEEKMWGRSQSINDVNSTSNEEINPKDERYEKRILLETNREKLPSFAQALKKPGYMDVQPFYQRRSRWDNRIQSLLIESFLLNIPVPPIILYEKSYNAYEVIDG